MPRLPAAAAIAALLALLAATLAPSASAATPSRKKAIWGPVTKDGVSQFPIYRELGAGIWQYAMNWSSVAPTKPANPANPADPAYVWPAELDVALSEARKQGIQVSVLLTGAPKWANGGRADSSWAPKNPRDFATFAQAASKRFPGVTHWMIWGEPSRDNNWKPLIAERRGQRLTPAQKRAPRSYARLLDATYAKLKSVDRRDKVIGGNTFTTGDISPRNYVREMRLANGRAPRMDLYGHNPFTGRRPNLSKPPLPSGFADFSDLDTLAAWLDRYQRRPGRKPLKIFISEWTLPTDVPSFEFNFFVSRKIQASWLKDALRISRRTNRIYTLGWLGLYDLSAQRPEQESRQGLIDAQGRRKPSFAAYRSG